MTNFSGGYTFYDPKGIRIVEKGSAINNVFIDSELRGGCGPGVGGIFGEELGSVLLAGSC
jgi:hypothetical protein